MPAPRSQPTFRGLAPLSTAFAVAAAAALASAPLRAAAYDFGDVCKVVITLKYTAPSVYEQSFSIESNQQSVTQDATASLQIQPGTFTLKTEGKLCNDLANNAFTGTSLATTIDGTENTDVAITVKALDTEVYAGVSQNADYAPIIVSVSVTPSHHVKYGDDVTISVGAIDPVDGVDPGGFALTIPNADANGAFDTQTCGAGTSCAVTYTAAAGDEGNIEFSMKVNDAASSLSDTVNGYIRVDPSTGVDFQVANYHAPQLEPMENLSPANGQVAWDATATFDVVVKDVDISRLNDLITISASTSVSQQLTEQHDSGMQTLACQASDLAWSAAGSAYTDGTDDKHKFEVTWDPWTSQKGATTQADWGETWCEFEFTPKDSMLLVGSAVKFTLGAVGTANSGGGFGQVPYFQQIFVSDYSPATGDTLTLFLTYHDPDSNVKLTVTPDAAFSNDAATVVGAQDCSSVPCQEQVTISVNSQGAHSITLELEDADDSTLKHTKVLTFEAPTRRLRRASGDGDMGDMQFQVSGTKLTATVPAMGDSAAPSGDSDHDDSGHDEGRDKGHAGSGGGGGGGFSSGALGGAVAGTALVVALVGVAVVSKLNKGAAPQGAGADGKAGLATEERRASVASIVFDDFSGPAQAGLSL